MKTGTGGNQVNIIYLFIYLFIYLTVYLVVKIVYKIATIAVDSVVLAISPSLRSFLII